MASILRTSKFIRHFVNLARSIVISNRQEVDVSLLQRSQNLVGVFPGNFSSTSYLQVNSSLERTVRRLDEDARKTGRISMKEIEEALHEIKHFRKATTSQSLMVIRCCGNLVPEETPERRTQLVEEIWKTLENLGVSLDISHYNALLKVYLENEHKFSPAEFLAKLEKKGVEPNRVTYQRLIAGYCQMGDIAGATKILEYMKEKQLPVSEGVFNALILGHSQANDMASAEGMLTVMKQASLEPSCETYTTLMCGYARCGDKAALERLIKDCKVKDILISDRDFLEVAYAAAISGHDELIDEILGNIRYMIGYNQDAVNVILRLVTKGKDEVAYKVFKTMQSAIKADGPNMSGHILIKQFINNNRSVESILSLCEQLEKDGHTQLGLYIAVEFSFHHGNIDMTMELLRAFKEKGQPIRNHFFWPSLCTAGKVNDRKTMNNILKRMVEEFDVSPSSDTIRDFYLPFVKSSSVDDTLGALLESGVRRGQAVKALVSFLITENKLSQAAELAYQHPKMNLRPQFVHRMLSEALAQTKDVKSVVGLVHVMSTRPLSVADSVETGEDAVTSSEDMCSRFLTNVVSNSSTRGMVAAVLKEMVTLGLQISNRCAEVVENQLQGNQLTTEISDMLAKLSSGELTPTAIKSPLFAGGKPIARNPPVLERIKDRILANNESTENLININRSLFQAYCFENDLDNALRIKKVWTDELNQELTAGMWAQLLACHCSKGDLQGAKECLDQINATNQDTVELDATKIVRVAKLYVENNQIDEAVNLLKNMKPREEDNSFHTKAACYQTLNSIAESTKDPEQVKRVFQTMLDKKYVDVSNVQLGPIIKAYLLKDDIAGALKEFETCVKKYRATPWKNELASRLIEKEDAANLQTLVDLSTIVHGEINSLYDLVLSFVECGRIRQARKILETPGLIMRNTRLQAACERYKNESRVEPLEGLVEATKDLLNINRSDIYYQLLQTYCQADNVDKALGLWTQMQEENVQVSDEFLAKLGSFLQSKGLKVPFSIPKVRDVVDDTPHKEEKKKTSELPRKQTQPSAFSSAVYAKNVDNALSIKARMEKSGEELTRNEVTRLIELLVEKKRFEDVTNVLVSLEDAKLPAMRTLNYAVSRLSMAGEMELLKRVGDRLSDELKKVTSFSNRYINCAVIAGKGKDELEKLEKQIDKAATTEEVDELATSFPFGGIFALLNSSPVHLEPVTRIAEKYYSRGVVTPVNCLCMFYLAEEQYDKARELYQHYNLNNASRLMFQHALSSARNKENPKILEELISLISNSPTFTKEVQGLLYSNLVNIYEKKGDLETALGKLEEALRTLPIEAIHTSTLVQLKTSLEAKNIPFKYTIPPRQKSKDSSTSSSSSDEEPKQSMAAKH